MKTLHLIRHAKSCWEAPALADHERPLNARGIKACQLMAQHTLNAGCQFTNVYCSPALRAKSTIELINEAIPDINIQWQLDDELYTFDSRVLQEWCRSLDESITEIVIVGHNPALTTFCNELSNNYIQNIPTCGYAQLIAERNGPWKELSETSFELVTFLRPKDFKNRK